MKLVVDVVIPSLSKLEHREMVRECIKSLKDSEQDIHFNVVLVESGAELVDLGQDHTVRFDLPSFNFHHAIKQGLALCKNKWIVIANNDLVFTNGWMKEIIRVSATDPEIKSFSPWEPRFHPLLHSGQNPVIKGYDVSLHIAGWCLVTTSDILEKINLSEEIAFWFSDNNYADELKKNKFIHALVRDAVVQHLGQQTTKLIDNKKELTHDQLENYKKIKK